MRRTRTRTRILFSVALTAGWLGMGAIPVSAHERWFVANPNQYTPNWLLLGSAPVLLAVAVAGIALIAARVADSLYHRWLRTRPGASINRFAGISEERLRRVYAYLPLLLAVHVAVPLLVSGFQLELFAPNLKMRTNLLSGVLALAEVLIALALIYGVFTDYAAIGLVALWIAALVFGPFVGIPPILVPEQALYLGFAAFLFIIGRGPFSGDALLGRRAHPNPQLVAYALPALRWGVGLSFVILAFTEKLLRPDLADAFLAQKIDFNLGAGFGVPNTLFVYGAGIAELTFGTLLIAGTLPRLVIVALWIPSNLTLPYLGWVELVGHLPIYGALLTLLIIGASSRADSRRSAFALAQEAGAIERQEAGNVAEPAVTPTA